MIMLTVANTMSICGSEYIVDLMGAPGTLIPAEVPSTHHQNSALSPLSSADTIDQSVKDLCLALDNVNSQKKSQTSEGSSSGNNSVSGIACLQLEEKSTAGPSAVGDNLRNSGKDQTEKSGNKMLLPPLDKPRADTSGATEAISPAQQMKVHDVSKYVVTAAKNPEFAQKLHAVLLESGASPPLDLFSDLNLSQDLVGQKDLGNICLDRREGRRDYQLPSKEAEPSNFADDKRKQQCFADNLSDKQGRNYDMFLNPVDASQPSPFITEKKGVLIQEARAGEIFANDSCAEGTDLVFGVAEPSRVQYQNQINVPSAPYEVDTSQKRFVSNLKEVCAQCSHTNADRSIINVSTQENFFMRDCQQDVKDPFLKFTGTVKNDRHNLRCADNERINSLLDDVADWEIPREDLQIGERIGLGKYEVQKFASACIE